MKILVISRLFAPTREIGAVRWTKLCKHLTGYGFDIDILCDRHTGGIDPLLLRDLSHCGHILRVGSTDEDNDIAAFSASAHTAAAKPAKPLPAGLKKAIINSFPFRKYQETLSAIKYWNRERRFAAEAIDRLISSRDVSQYDCIISTFGPLGDVLTALELKRQYPDIPLIADFRDPMVTSVTPWLLRSKQKNYQRQFCDAASVILAVSRGYANSICSCEAHTQKCIVLRNGFDSEDAQTTYTAPESDDRFTLCCTGDLYKGKRDMSPLFSVLKQLAECGDIDRRRVVVKYAGSSTAVICEQADSYGVRDMVETLGVINRQDALALQRASQILLLPNWNYTKEQGVLPGKFYEYAQAGVPVILLTSGDAAGSELRSLMDEARLGVSYEEATADTDMPLLCEYIKRQYDRFVAGEPLEYAPDSDMLAQFEYGNIAKRAADIIREAVGNRN